MHDPFSQSQVGMCTSVVVFKKRRNCVAFVSVVHASGLGIYFPFMASTIVYCSMISVMLRRRRLRLSSSSSSELGRCSGDLRSGEWRLGSLDGPPWWW